MLPGRLPADTCVPVLARPQPKLISSPSPTTRLLHSTLLEIHFLSICGSNSRSTVFNNTGSYQLARPSYIQAAQALSAILPLLYVSTST